jgi:hypothetical protein
MVTRRGRRERPKEANSTTRAAGAIAPDGQSARQRRFCPCGQHLEVMECPEMRNLFNADQHQCDPRQNKLHSFHAYLRRGHRLSSPLRGRTVSQTPDLPQDHQVQQRPGQGKCHHRNANPVLMEVVPSNACLSSRGQRPCSNHKPETIESSKKRTHALQNGKYKTRPHNAALCLDNSLRQQCRNVFLCRFKGSGARKR